MSHDFTSSYVGDIVAFIVHNIENYQFIIYEKI